MNRFGAWMVSVGCLVLGIVSFLGASSLLRPATNPMSDAAGGFQASLFQGTALAAVLFFIAEVAASRWSAPAGGWRWAWVMIGALFLLLGVPLLVEALADTGPLGARTRPFRLGIGGLWVALGIVGCAFPFAARGPKPPV
jgi:hypothetical protein